MMVLYTPISHDDIFLQDGKRFKLVTYQGKSLYVTENELGELQVEQLVSSDPQDFLNASYSPGAVLKNEFVQQMK